MVAVTRVAVEVIEAVAGSNSNSNILIVNIMQYEMVIAAGVEA